MNQPTGPGRLRATLMALRSLPRPLIVLSDQGWQTAPVALAGLAREHVQDNELMMAGSVVTTLPVLILFLILQRHYIQGLMLGSVKG